MVSINKQQVYQRVSLIYDQLHATQAQEKDVKTYTNGLLRNVGEANKTAGSAKDFAQDFGAGI